MIKTTMQNDLIVKQANKLIESVYRMDANEQKLILLATQIVNQIERNGQDFTSETEIVIAAHQYAKAFGVSRATAFEIICEAKNTIYDRSFKIDYEDANGVIKPTESRWIHRKGEMKTKSEISMFFAPAVIPYIYLVKDEFTLMDLREIGRLKSKYAIRLYKILMKWRNAKYQPKFEYDELRAMLGVEDGEYLLKSDFQKRVLKIAVDQINKGTSFINLKYTSVKDGKTITHFVFSYDGYDSQTFNVTPLDVMKGKTVQDAQKKQKKPSTGESERNSEGVSKQADMFEEKKEPKRYYSDGMTEGQAYMFASKIVEKIQKNDPRFISLGQLANDGEDAESFKSKIVENFLIGDFRGYEEALKHLKCKEHNFLIHIGERKRAV